MLFSIKNREDLEILIDLISWQDQVKALRLQDNLGKQNSHEDMKKVIEPVTRSIKDVCQGVTGAMTEASFENNRTLENTNIKLLGRMNDRCIIASCLLSLLSKIFNPEHIS